MRSRVRDEGQIGRVSVKDEGRVDKPYFVYIQDKAGWMNFTGARFNSRRRAESVAAFIEKKLKEEA